MVVDFVIGLSMWLLLLRMSTIQSRLGIAAEK